MLTIYCALYLEAKEIIRTFQLKKETGRAHFQVFLDEKRSIRLVITGVGAIAAATAVAEISALFPPKGTDLLLNFGICAAGADVPVGELFLCNKLTEECSGRTFYPDVLYQHPFRETELVSCGEVQTAELLKKMNRGRDMFTDDRDVCDEEKQNVRLYDMEAAAVYQTGSYSYGPHQMLFLKVVSDHGTEQLKENSCRSVTDRARDHGGFREPVDVRKQLSLILQNSSSKVCSYIFTLLKICQAGEKEIEEKFMLRQQVQEDAAMLGEQLHCSVVMQGELEQLLWYFRLVGVDYGEMVNDFRRRGRIPTRDKREGKKILDELRGNIF